MDASRLLNRPDLTPELVQRAFAAGGVELSRIAAVELVGQRTAGPFLSELDVLARVQGIDADQLAGLGEALSAGRLDDLVSSVSLLRVYFEQPGLIPEQVDRAFEVAGRDIGPVIGRSLIEAARRGRLNNIDDFLNVRLVGPKRLGLMLNAVESGVLFAPRDQVAPLYFLPDEDGGVGRTVERRNCNIGSTRFGINFYGRRTRMKNGVKYDEEGAITIKGKPLKKRLATLKPQLRLNTNCRLGVAVVADVKGDYNGTQIVEVFRDVGSDPGSTLPARQTDATLVRTISGATDLGDLRARSKQVSDIRVGPPAKIKPGQVLTETIAIRYTWKPDDFDPCGFHERLLIVWVGEPGEVGPRYKVPKGPSTSNPYVVVGGTLQPPDDKKKDDKDKEATGHYTISAFTYFPLEKKSEGCCGVKNLAYAVIQFVRHSYKYKSQKKQYDKWSLDILDEEVKRASDKKDYDPTYTLDPCDRKAKAYDAAKTDAARKKIIVPPPVVYPGADTRLKPAINQVDAPGFSVPLYRDLIERGESFTWHFYSFLVCRLGDCKASAYLSDARVKAYLQWELTVNFVRKGRTVTPKVKPPKRDKQVYKVFRKCRPLKDVIAEIDKKRNKRDSEREGTLLEGFTSPREHGIGVKRRRTAK